MAAATRKPVRRTSGRVLLEWSASAPSGSPLTVDRDAGVIYGVKVLGYHSRNSHGIKEASEGTEYTRACMQDALPLYEGVGVIVNHDAPTPKGSKQPRKPRDSNDVFGQLRNVRLADDGVRADLHYLKSHGMADRVCEDVERSLGVFGLSHNATSGEDRIDRGRKRLVIESLATVRSVDLVHRPATNRNLWESHEEEAMPTTLREILDERRPKLSKPRRKWADRLLEDDALAPSMDAPMDAPATGTDPDDALWTGFMAAIQAIGESYKAGELGAKEAGKKVTDYLKAHESLTGDKEPAAPPAESSSDSDDDDPPSKDKTESELETTKHKLAVRELCEELKVSPDKTLLESLEALPIDQGRKLVEREKARGTGGGAPRGAGAHGGGGNRGTGGAPKKLRGPAFLDGITQ